MEKRAVVEPGRTPDKDTGEKKASGEQDRAAQLDNDFTKQAAETAADALKRD